MSNKSKSTKKKNKIMEALVEPHFRAAPGSSSSRDSDTHFSSRKMAHLVVKCGIGKANNAFAGGGKGRGGGMSRLCREMIMEILSWGRTTSTSGEWRPHREERDRNPFLVEYFGNSHPASLSPVHYLGFGGRMRNDLWIHELFAKYTEGSGFLDGQPAQ